jgi:four helix bundle protein
MEQWCSQHIVQNKNSHLSVQRVGHIRRQPSDHVNMVLTRQLLRSGTSIGTNIQEAWSWAG